MTPARRLSGADELTTKANVGTGAAIKAPSVFVDLVKSRVVRCFRLWIRDLPEPIAALGNKRGREDVQANVFRTLDDFRTYAIALALFDFECEVAPAPLADHVLQICSGPRTARGNIACR